jgi:hypothetical protein
MFAAVELASTVSNPYYTSSNFTVVDANSASAGLRGMEQPGNLLVSLCAHGRKGVLRPVRAWTITRGLIMAKLTSLRAGFSSVLVWW